MKATKKISKQFLVKFPLAICNFAKSYLKDWKIVVMRKWLKYKVLNEILLLAKAIPFVMDNKDCAIKSETGSGKTLTYIVPII